MDSNPFGTPMSSRKVRRMFEAGKGNAAVSGPNSTPFGFKSVGTFVGDYKDLDERPKRRSPNQQ